MESLITYPIVQTHTDMDPAICSPGIPTTIARDPLIREMFRETGRFDPFPSTTGMRALPLTRVSGFGWGLIWQDRLVERAGAEALQVHGYVLEAN